MSLPEPPPGWQPPPPPGWVPPGGPVFGPPVCSLCGAALPSDDPGRCGECGMRQQMGPERANPFQGAPALVTLFVTLAVVYAITYVIIALK